jgi:rhamnogalacturonyl hydrolase YesR
MEGNEMWNVAVVVLLAVLGTACDGGGIDENEVPEISSREIAETMRSVREYQLAQLPDDRKLRGWRVCPFFAGMMEAYRATGDPAYRDSTRAWAKRNEWKLGPDSQDANDHCVGQVYLELYLERGQKGWISHAKRVLGEVVERGRRGNEMWDWADALFMAPPAIARLGEVAGKKNYFDFVGERFQEASHPLFDREYGLYYRDTRFKDWRTENGHPVFWSRGNGWVIAGITRILQSLPESDDSRPWFKIRFRVMAASLKSKQQRSGFWRPSLLDSEDVPVPETSGTGLFCYALAWGVNKGLLDRSRFEPVVRRAWNALERAVKKSGRLGWVQSPHSRPAPVSEQDTYPYGSGALLLAGSQTLRMIGEGQ